MWKDDSSKQVSKQADEFNALRNEGEQLDVHVACAALQSQGQQDLL